MNAHRLPIFLFAFSLGMGFQGPAQAQEVYRWVDENGVVNFSDTAPRAVDRDVDTVRLADTAPKDYDPDEDRYHVAAQAERMQALREEMQKQREQRRESRPGVPARNPPPQDTRYGYPVAWPGYGRPPVKPRPPIEPRPPRPEPYETSTLRPPGQQQDPGGP